MFVQTMIRAALAAALALGLGAAAAAQALQVGAYPANPPWQAKQPDGSFEGFEVDLVREIAERMGREVEFSDLGFQALFAAVASGRIDMAISSISVTPDRLQNQAFTQPYFDSDLSLVSREDSDLASLEDMEGRTIGAISTSTGEAWIKENMETYGIGEYRGYDTQANLLMDVQSGRLDGAVGDVGGFEHAFMTNMPNLHVVDRMKTGDQFAIMLRKGSPLLEEVDQAISEIKDDGTLAEIHRKHLGSEPPADSSTVTVLPIPQAGG